MTSLTINKTDKGIRLHMEGTIPDLAEVLANAIAQNPILQEALELALESIIYHNSNTNESLQN